MLSETYSGGTLDVFLVTNKLDHLLRRTNLLAKYSTTALLQQSSTFDAASRLLSVSNSAASSSYAATHTYLANSPLVSQIAFTNGGARRMLTTKTYDLLNRLTNITSTPSALFRAGDQFRLWAEQRQSANLRHQRG